MKTTCGIFLINKKDNTVLLCHPTNASLLSWSIPKGEYEEDDTNYRERAIKELFNETGISINKEHIEIELPFVKYPNNKKQLKPFVVFLDESLLPLPKLNCKELVNNKFPEVDLYVWSPLRLSHKLIHKSQSQALCFFLDTYKEYNF